MNNERIRELAAALPHVEETVQWGDNLVFWVGDKAVGGKMFCVVNLEAGQKCVASFAAGPDGEAELCEREGLMPAPYFARLHWVCAQRWDSLTAAEWKDCLTRAHALTLAKLTQRTRDVLALQPKQRLAQIRSARERLLEKAAARAQVAPKHRLR